MSGPAFGEFFEDVTGNGEGTGHRPFPYQQRLGTEPWPEILDVPTGLGKTAAVLVAWLYKRLHGDPETGRRLVYCLPMRTLVEQTHEVAEQLLARAAPHFTDRGLSLPTAHRMLGGFVDERWEAHPERPAILVGTQDMLLSRALARGYAMSRTKWPIHFGLLQSDVLWVFDETQLMGVGVETSAQLAAFRRSMGVFGPARSLWMSATLGRAQLSTVDHREPPTGFRTLGLGPADRDGAVVRARTGARKALQRAAVSLDKGSAKTFASSLAEKVSEVHADRGGLTLVVLNRVSRAQATFRALNDLGVGRTALIHSRFRPRDRAQNQSVLHEDGDRIVVATQAVEAGVDVSARTLWTELAPWPSLVQRFGRCNRYGESDDARVMWIDVDATSDASLALPYAPAELETARALLTSVEEVGPDAVGAVDYAPPDVVRPVLRRRDVLELFDTTPDLLGNDLDVARFVRDDQDSDVQFFWRPFEGSPTEGAAPHRDEMLRVSLGAARDFLDALKKKRQALGRGAVTRERVALLTPYAWNPLADRRGDGDRDSARWLAVDRPRPNQVILCHPEAGGYDPTTGWIGEAAPGQPVPAVEPDERTGTLDAMDDDPRTFVDRWVPLTVHLGDVGDEARSLVSQVELPDPWADAVVTAATWHDVGKAHDEFQRRLLGPLAADERPPPPGETWAKSDHRRRPPHDVRPFFRHELASALAWLQTEQGPPATRDLVAFLIAAHHGKVRLSLRSVPGEAQPADTDRAFARGVWHEDPLPPVTLPDGTTTPALDLALEPLLRLGAGSWLDRMLRLRDDPDTGPFRLAYLETLVRVADWRGSEKERLDA